VPEKGRELGMMELQKQFNAILSLPNKTETQMEEMKNLQIKIENERKKIDLIRRNRN